MKAIKVKCSKFVSTDGYYEIYPYDPDKKVFNLRRNYPKSLVGSTYVEIKSLGFKWVYWRNKCSKPTYTRLLRSEWDTYKGKVELSIKDKLHLIKLQKRRMTWKLNTRFTY